MLPPNKVFTAAKSIRLRKYPLGAKQGFSLELVCGGPKWTRTTDLTIISRTL